MTEKTWQQRFTNEFGKHFSPSELQFALEFVDEMRKEAFEEGRDTGMKADEVLREEGRKERRDAIIEMMRLAMIKRMNGICYVPMEDGTTLRVTCEYGDCNHSGYNNGLQKAIDILK